ncbi:MAG: carboxypeptidase-like regulatory domain-containing protein [Pirellulales bacterium]
MTTSRQHRKLDRRVWQPVALLAVVVFAACVGCRQAPAGATVQGTVTYKDQPLTEASITFLPAAGRPIATAVGAEGHYQLALPPGSYRVVVNKIDRPPANWKEGDPIPKPTFVLPAQFTEPAATVLKADVTGEASQSVDFQLQ